MRARRFISIAGAVLMAFALACCRGKGAPAVVEGQVPLPAGPSAPVIHFITWNEDYLATLKREIPNFEKETGVRVDWQILSEDVVREKVLVDLSSGSGKYDLVLTDVWILPEHVAAGVIEPLDSFIEKDGAFDREAWYETYLKALSYEGHLYALPTESFGPALVYRKDLFEEHKVKVPTTIAELMAAAKKLTLDTDGDGRIDVYGVVSRGKAGEEPAIVVSGFAWAEGGSWFEGGASTAEEIKRKKARPAFNSPRFQKGFTAYTEMMRRYGPPDSKNYTWYEIVRDGRAGRAAMILNCGFNIGAVDKEEVGMRDKYSAALPVRGPRGYTQENFAMGYGINRKSSNKQAAWQFLKFITGVPFMKSVMEDYATSIPMRSIIESSRYREMHPYRMPDGGYVLEKSIDVIDWRYMPRLPEYSVIANRLGRATSEVIAGTKSAREALNELNASVEKIMERAGYYR